MSHDGIKMGREATENTHAVEWRGAGVGGQSFYVQLTPGGCSSDGLRR